MPLLDKMTFYYHCARMNYFSESTNRLVFAKNLILHGSYQANYFSTVEQTLNDYNFFEYGSSMADSWIAITNCLGSWFDCWSGGYLEENVFDWVINNLEYRYDSETSYGRSYNFDLYMAALETLKYRAGDCDDFSTLGGTMFENNGYNVAFATIHDSVYYPGGLHHAFLFVEVGEARWLAKRPLFNPNWVWQMFGSTGYDWIIVDLTPGWQSDPWREPAWLD